MYVSVSRVVTLVGGMWHDNTRCGLWYWNCNNASTVANGDIGARLLIKNRDLVCTLRCLVSLELLSAVGGQTVLIVACGIGTLTMRLRTTMLTSELDHLY